MQTEPHKEAEPQAALQPRNRRTIALVGLMGAGKSSVGKRLAQHLGLPFHDSDDEIETAAGLCISDIFSLYGEAEFRRVERKVLERLVTGPRIVLATGGGAYLDSDTRTLLRNHAVTIWLRADLETLWRRVCRKDTRPLLRTENPKQKLASLLEARAPVYAEADLVVDSHDGPHSQSVNDVVTALETWTAHEQS